MKTSEKLRWLSAIGLNLFVTLSVFWSATHMYLYRGDGNMQVAGKWIFVYFTTDSNVLCALTCIPMAVFGIRKLLGKTEPVPQWILLFKYIGTAGVTVTLLTVLLFLGPVFGYRGLFAGNNLCLHLLAPLAAIVSFTLLEREGRLYLRHVWLTVIPTLVYAVVYVREVIVIGYENGGWRDFYGFNTWGTWYLMLVVMLAATWLIGLALRIVHNAMMTEAKGQL